MKFEYLKNLGAIALCFGLASVCAAQGHATGPDRGRPGGFTRIARGSSWSRSTSRRTGCCAAARTALSTPAITGPLSNLPPAIFDAGPFGKIAVNGILTGFGMWQSNQFRATATRKPS